MEPDRPEIYERIPWETLEKQGNDRQWLLYAVAGAVVLGALAYSFMKNQPAAMPPPSIAAATSVPATTVTTAVAVPQPPTVASPLVVAEADLYAVDPERLMDQAAAHAEWLAVEFVAFDGTDQSSQTLSGLLPEDVPLPEAPEGTQVFVDWARTASVSRTGPASFAVEVMVRSLVSTDGGAFERQPMRLLSVDIVVDDERGARVAGLPSLSTADPAPSPALGLSELSKEMSAGIDPALGEPVATVTVNGSQQVVVMADGSDGVRRPALLSP